jgi:sec-independent protein translocase protein TatA
MGSFSIWHWLIVLVVVLLLFGRGKIPELMGDFAKGIKSFKRGMADDETEVGKPVPPVDPRVIDHKTDPAVSANPEDARKV